MGFVLVRHSAVDHRRVNMGWESHSLFVNVRPSERKEKKMKWVRENLCLWSVSSAAKNDIWHVDDSCFKDTKMCKPWSWATRVRVIKCDHAVQLCTCCICGCTVHIFWNTLCTFNAWDSSWREKPQVVTLCATQPPEIQPGEGRNQWNTCFRRPSLRNHHLGFDRECRPTVGSSISEKLLCHQRWCDETQLDETRWDEMRHYPLVSSETNWHTPSTLYLQKPLPTVLSTLMNSTLVSKKKKKSPSQRLLIRFSHLTPRLPLVLLRHRPLLLRHRQLLPSRPFSWPLDFTASAFFADFASLQSWRGWISPP